MRPTNPRPLPHFTYETEGRAAGHAVIAGVDEVGRGPLAGPVTAAAVRLDPDRIPPGLNDSKRLSARQRTALSALLMDTAEVSIAHASVAEIEALNILHASLLAMTRAVAGLRTAPDLLLVDGNRLPPGLTCRMVPITRGDTLSLSIAAASIVAKVARDRIMADLAALHPGYGWERNAGYPTRAHKAALTHLGVTAHHRRSFGPVHKML